MLAARPKQGQEKTETDVWCDQHNFSSHPNTSGRQTVSLLAKANTAKAEIPVTTATVASSNIPENYDSDGSAVNAFIANQTAKAEDEFIIDSVHLFPAQGYPRSSTKHACIGDGTFLPYSSAGTLQLGGIGREFLVPGSSCNLIIRSTPSRYRCDFSPHFVPSGAHAQSE